MFSSPLLLNRMLSTGAGHCVHKHNKQWARSVSVMLTCVCMCVHVCVSGIVQLLLLDFFLSLSATFNLTQQKIEAPAECKSMLS